MGLLMPNYAIHDGETVVNVIIADTQGLAEQLTGMQAVETEGAPWIGWVRVGDEWRPPAPFPSWDWDGSDWIAPVPYPSEPGAWFWNEAAGSWDTLGPNDE